MCDRLDSSVLQRSAVWRTFGATGAVRVAQSFSLTRTGTLAEIHIELNCELEGSLTAELQRVTSMNGGPGQLSGMQLRRLRDAGVAPQSGWHMLVVDGGGLALAAGETVAVVLGATQGTCSVNDANGAYAAGHIFSQERGTQTWLSRASSAFVFRTLVR